MTNPISRNPMLHNLIPGCYKTVVNKWMIVLSNLPFNFFEGVTQVASVTSMYLDEVIRVVGIACTCPVSDMIVVSAEESISVLSWIPESIILLFRSIDY